VTSRDSNSRLPPAGAGWKTGTRLHADGFIGGASTLHRKLEELKSSLVADITSAGISKSDAIAIVDHNLVGLRGTRTVDALHASPDALAILNLQHRDSVSSPEDSWRSPTELTKEFKGNNQHINHKLNQFVSQVRERLLADGYSQSEAIKLVDSNLIGQRRPSSGPIGNYASQEAIKRMTSIGILEPKER
jgi:uncharacterized protein YoaH (UPF0181 family)